MGVAGALDALAIAARDPALLRRVGAALSLPGGVSLGVLACSLACCCSVWQQRRVALGLPGGASLGVRRVVWRVARLA